MTVEPEKKWFFCFRQDRRRSQLEGWVPVGPFESEKEASEERARRKRQADADVGNVFLALQDEARRRCASGATG